MKNKKHVWVAGAMCVLPLMGMAQQTEPLTDSRRLFDDGKSYFFVVTMQRRNRPCRALYSRNRRLHWLMKQLI